MARTGKNIPAHSLMTGDKPPKHVDNFVEFLLTICAITSVIGAVFL
ncbi:hypothetical protein APT_00719 [Acetobacter pasteurianus NBRC 101655]|nr:hypothetical protein APT_00719 [Acetobacter pasteurianus NBRC 101655]CCT60319.1 hypothetical protein APA386B_2278 [Acetobacter pasteurianus 386B]